jgi:hypothetical protein
MEELVGDGVAHTSSVGSCWVMYLWLCDISSLSKGDQS